MITNIPHIARDTWTGTWTRRGIPAGYRADSFTAAELTMLFGQEEFVIWESAGHMRGGKELFVRSRKVPQADGSLAGYDANGRLVIVHPATRNLRILTR
jgi:hypothetical protein